MHLRCTAVTRLGFSKERQLVRTATPATRVVGRCEAPKPTYQFLVLAGAGRPRSATVSHMNKLDAVRLICILMRLIRARGEIRVFESKAGRIIVSLSRRGYPRVDITISAAAIEVLAEHLRVIT